MNKAETEGGASASAPGKAIFFGEHAVVYDKLGVVTTINKRCFVKTTQYKDGRIFIKSNPLRIRKKIRFEKINKILSKYEELKRTNDIFGIKKLARNVLTPLLVVIGFTIKKLKNLSYLPGIKIEINSKVPKNLGSSSSVFSATSLALSKFLGKNLKKDEISKIAYEGDIIAHGGISSGIDNLAVTYGGWFKYRKSKGAEPMFVNFKVPILVVDSGEPSKTSEMVFFLRMLFEKKKNFMESIMDKLNTISLLGAEAIKHMNLNKVGFLMTQYYEVLKKTGISTDKLDEIVSLAIKNEALGAKPTGGWGGGCCLVLAKNNDKLMELKKMYEEFSFKAFITELGVEGVRVEQNFLPFD